MDEQPQIEPGQQPTPVIQEPQSDSISWTASEYIHHSKSPVWYIALVVAMLLVIALAVKVGSLTFIMLTVVMAVALMAVSIRKPRILQYVINTQGLNIDQKFYALNEFKSFGVTTEGAFFSITLIPVKRFMPAVTIYFAEEDGEKIVDILGSHMAMQHIEPDFIDKFTKLIRF
jgi:hypothetical protein